MYHCPNCDVRMAYPLNQCRGGRCFNCGYRSGDLDKKARGQKEDAIKLEQEERTEFKWRERQQKKQRQGVQHPRYRQNERQGQPRGVNSLPKSGGCMIVLGLLSGCLIFVFTFILIVGSIFN